MTIAIDAQNLTKKFGNFIAVNDVTMALQEGGVYGFLGPNGSGKSTTIRMMAGLLLPTSGTGHVFGYNILTQSEAIKTLIGYVSQKFSLYTDLTIFENLDFYGGLYDLPLRLRRERIAEVMEMLHLTAKQDVLVSSLSGGWRQRLALGCAILHRPRLLFLDEATSGADPNTRRLFWKLIYQLASQGTTILVTTHFLDEAEYCDEIAFIHNGTLVALDTPENLKKQLPGQLYTISSESPIDLLEEIQQKNLPILDSYIHGQSVRLRIDPSYLKQISQYNPQDISPTLEDVFIYQVEKDRKEMKGETL